jgi:inosine/guanosine/xanthosine phosphorylase family protein
VSFDPAADVDPPVDALPRPPDDPAPAAARAVRAATSLRPAAGIVLGSGLAPLLDGLDARYEIPYGELPGFPIPSVPGHEGRLRLGEIAGVPVAAFLGRFHYYEGHSMAVASLPVRVARLLGAHTIVLTAAVGALHSELAAGTVVIATDHLNMMGVSPLRGWRHPDGTPPFIELSGTYDRELGTTALRAARVRDVPVAEGIYAAMAGPSYETPAETAFLRGAGATVVGMSVVPEAVPSRALGMRVLGMFAVTNAVGEAVEHHEVLRASMRAARSMGLILGEVLPRVRPTDVAPRT